MTYKTIKEAQQHLKKNEIIIKVKGGFMIIKELRKIPEKFWAK